MRFTATPIPGVWLIALEPACDERGFFARSWCRQEFLAHGLDADLCQCNLSRNRRAGTLRGLHWSVPPAAEAKLVRCVRGAIFDVVVDLRPGSPTHRRWFAATLDAEGGQALYIPAGLAHGFQTLCDDSDVWYQMSVPFDPACARGARWDDPAFAIAWPAVPERIISARDAAYPLVGA
jgi:dTDP-4-dehydrorhamnose 3,5-epimerase